jgi:hypothetical protein
MPLAWIHDIPKQQLEELASQLSLSTDKTLDDVRKRVKEKWPAVELYLPSQNTAKSSLFTTPVQQNMDPVYQRNCLSKVKIKLATDLISSIPVLSSNDPEEILKFLMSAKGGFDLKLISESEFTAFWSVGPRVGLPKSLEPI